MLEALRQWRAAPQKEMARRSELEETRRKAELLRLKLEASIAREAEINRLFASALPKHEDKT